MNDNPLEVLSTASNSWVIKISDRAYPGVLVQGDSLNNLLVLAQEVVASIEAAEYDEAKSTASEIVDIIASMLSIYEAAMKEHGKELPYPRRV